MLKKDDNLTPMMEQYQRIKAQYRDCLLFFRLGDFYEMFYEDAYTGSQVLGIALTSRQNVPMCGVPYHAVNSYLVRLLKAGHRVAICEQVEDPRLAKGVVRREVLKVLTPGTAVEIETDELGEEYGVASLLLEEEKWGLAYADLLTAIENERRLEFAFEGHRWFDLVRTGRAVDVLPTVNSINQTLFPIPLSELLTNTNPGMNQNPGY